MLRRPSSIRIRRFSVVLIAASAAHAHALDRTQFVQRTFIDAPHTASIADVYGSGRLQVPGLVNLGKSMGSRSRSAMGLQATAGTFGVWTRHARDMRVADLDNDGRPDLVANTYFCSGETRDRALLFLQAPDGTFRAGSGFDALPPMTGWGETIVAADFDNDGFLDIYLPAYTRSDDDIERREDCAYLGSNTGGRSYLLRNRGRAAPATFDIVLGSPVDLTEASCGADCANYGTDPYARPEGAQGADIDEDGNIDLFVSGIVFRNEGNARFVRMFPAPGAVPAFDEGSKFLDWNNDGYPDLVIVTPSSGLVTLFSWSGGTRDPSGRIATGNLVEVRDPAIVSTFMSSAAPGTYGLTVADVNGDGYEDIVVNGALFDPRPKIFVNEGPPAYRFRVEYPLGPLALRAGRGGIAAGDLNDDGRLDLVFPGKPTDALTHVLYNVTGPLPANLLVVEVLGGKPAAPLRNQAGRVVRVTPESGAPTGFSYTRYVDGGSGYMAQGSYAVHVASLYSGAHRVDIRFAGHVLSCRVVLPAKLLAFADPSLGCQTQPLPQPQPIPRDHHDRYLAPTMRLLLE